MSGPLSCGSQGTMKQFSANPASQKTHGYFRDSGGSTCVNNSNSVAFLSVTPLQIVSRTLLTISELRRCQEKPDRSD